MEKKKSVRGQAGLMQTVVKRYIRVNGFYDHSIAGSRATVTEEGECQ